MKKKNIKILLLTLGIIVTLSVSVFAVEGVKRLIGPPVAQEPTEEEIREVLLKEKEEYSLKENMQKSELIQKYNIEEDTGLQNKLKEAEQEKNKMEKVIISVMNKFYPNEFPTILKELQNRETNSYNSPKLQEVDYKFYNLILNVLENETLTNEEKTALEDFIISQTHELRKDEELQNRYERLDLE